MLEDDQGIVENKLVYAVHKWEEDLRERRPGGKSPVYFNRQ
jgi:hypothetical protein